MHSQLHSDREGLSDRGDLSGQFAKGQITDFRILCVFGRKGTQSVRKTKTGRSGNKVQHGKKRRDTSRLFDCGFFHVTTATIIGSGPNGLSAAIVLAAAGIDTKVLEMNSRVGGDMLDSRDYAAWISSRPGIIRLSDGTCESFLSVVACFDPLDNPSRSMRTSS